MKNPLESCASTSEQPLRDDHVSDEPRDVLRVGDPLPARLTSRDLMRIFEIKPSQFYNLQAQGKFDRFELRPTIGRRAWSGKLVQKFLDGEPSSRFNLSKSA